MNFGASAAGREWLATELALQQYTRPCSHCKAALQKSAGCDHVVCTSCHQDMCWRCGTHVHLTGKLVRHCSLCKHDYRDHRYDRVYRVRLICVLPLILPFVILYLLLAVVVAVLTGCFGGCFRCGRCFVFRNNNTNTDNNNNNDTNNTHRVVAPQMTVPNGNGDNGPMRGSARLGILASIIIVLLPIVLLSEDFGLHWRWLDEVFPEPENEMPVLEVIQTASTETASTTTTTTTTTKKQRQRGKSDKNETIHSSGQSDLDDALARMEEGV